VGVRHSNKLEKVFEKCESLEAKMGGMDRMGRGELGGGEYVLCMVVQRWEGENVRVLANLLTICAKVCFNGPDRKIKD
jgi:hypothetical protein